MVPRDLETVAYAFLVQKRKQRKMLPTLVVVRVMLVLLYSYYIFCNLNSDIKGGVNEDHKSRENRTRFAHSGPARLASNDGHRAKCLTIGERATASCFGTRYATR